jgi:small-conductance mechanosensitive channel
MGWMLRRGAAVAALGAPLLAAAGYYAASRDLLLPAIQTAGLLGVASLTQGLVREAVGAMAADGRGPRLAPVLSGAVLLALGLPLLAVIWGADWADVADIGRMAVEGFQIGATTFRPLDAAFFAAVFALVYALTRLFQRVLRVSVLPQMGVTEGSQSALISGVGYVGVFVAGLAAISATGLDLSNLAIVAGALSVGVGFGLQTIVNNFVSGIILLVERPIKVGDWIEANMVHGIVRKVNVRSTMIETFDRSTYIIPNSQLVAQPVTNFTHSNLTGRLIIPVRVTRDANVRLVERILLELGQRHPMALRRPAPHVLFFDFGPNGTFDFELRLFLRDVNLRLTVASELRFAIVERFRAEGVAFAHPQQDVWVRGGAAEDGAAQDRATRDGAAGAQMAALASPAAAGGRP